MSTIKITGGSIEIDQLHPQLGSEKSYDLGVVGEEYVYNVLSENFSHIAEVISVRSCAKSCDLIIKFDDCTIAIEVKNKDKVTQHEIDIFYTTLRDTTEYDGGIFVSLRGNWTLPRYSTEPSPHCFIYGPSVEQICNTVCSLRYKITSTVCDDKSFNEEITALAVTHSKLVSHSINKIHAGIDQLNRSLSDIQVKLAGLMCQMNMVKMYDDVVQNTISKEEDVTKLQIILRDNLNVLSEIKNNPRVTKRYLIEKYPNSTFLKLSLQVLKGMAQM